MTAMNADCFITRTDGSGPGDWNPTTGLVPAANTLTVYDGPCRVQAASTQPTDVLTAGQVTAEADYHVHIPVTGTEIHAGTTAGDTITISAAPNDPTLAGRVMRIIAVTHGSEQFATTLTCQDLTTRRTSP